MQKTTTVLMFGGDEAGKAEEAMRFYTSLFKDSEIKSITRFQAGEQGGEEDMVKNGVFSLQGQEYMAMDSTGPHAFTFTPSMSIFVRCDGGEEIDRLYKSLSEGGTELMPLNDYGFSRKFGWVNDKYGVSWQMNLQ